MKFEINDEELDKLNKWKENIKAIYDKYGGYDYTFTPTGIGTMIVVTSHLTKTTICLSNVDNW